MLVECAFTSFVVYRGVVSLLEELWKVLRQVFLGFQSFMLREILEAANSVAEVIFRAFL